MSTSLPSSISPPGGAAVSSTGSPWAAGLSDRRLFVANLAPGVTEHDLLVLFHPHGQLRKLDLVFHRSGPQKGKPKGYAFVELATAEQAKRARLAVEGKLVKGREVRVRYASLEGGHGEQEQSSSGRGGGGPQRRRTAAPAAADDVAKPTMLSLVKNMNRKDNTNERIAAMEAKLEAMRQQRQRGDVDSSPSSHSSSRTPGLPAKPQQALRR